jgi:sporulation protein YlmC with PRC-barrel domain
MARFTDQRPLVKLSDADNLRLEDRAQDIRGLDVYDGEGNQVGSVEDLYVDREARKVCFLDVGAGGLLGIGEKHFMIPVEAVTDVGEHGVTIEQDAERVIGSPPFDTNVVDTADYRRDVYDHYGYTHPRDSYPADAGDEPRKAERASNEVPPSLAWSGGRTEGGTDREMIGRERPGLIGKEREGRERSR